jgi:probable rRNA maturation factor
VTTIVEVSGSVPRLTQREIATFVRKALVSLERMGAIDGEIREASIAFVDDAAMKTLNRRFRRKNRTTDVLTFPADRSYADPGEEGRPLGDIVISVEQARRQAADEKHALATEIRYLILHGILHALGYDHEHDQGEMNALELRARAAVGLQ